MKSIWYLLHKRSHTGPRVCSPPRGRARASSWEFVKCKLKTFYQLILAGFNIRACVSTWSRWSRSQDQDQSGAKPGQACWWSYSTDHYFDDDNEHNNVVSWSVDQQIPVCKSDSAAAKTNKELCKQRHLVQTLLNIAICFISCEAHNWILITL